MIVYGLPINTFKWPVVIREYMNTVKGERLPLLAFFGEYDPCKFKPVENIPFKDKPDGGLWTSPYKDEKYSDWVDFCYAAGFYTSPYICETRKKEMKPILTILKMVRTSKVLVIDSYKDLDSVFKAYEKPATDKKTMEIIDHLRKKGHDLTLELFEEDMMHRGYIDFERVSKDFDALWLTKSGLARTKWTEPRDLRGWDVETVLIFNPECFDIVKKVEVKKCF